MGVIIWRQLNFEEGVDRGGEWHDAVTEWQVLSGDFSDRDTIKAYMQSTELENERFAVFTEIDHDDESLPGGYEREIVSAKRDENGVVSLRKVGD